MKEKMTKSNLELLTKVSGHLAVEFPTGKASREDVLKSIKNSGIRCNAGGAVKYLIKEGFAAQEGNTITLINNKGGENIIPKKAPAKEIPNEIKDMIWEIAEIKSELFKEFPSIFGGIKSIEYGGKAVTIKNKAGKQKVFFNFYSEEGEEAIKLIYFSCKGMGLIK